MEKYFWHRRWEKNEIGFHQPDGSTLLKKHLKVLTPGTIFIPLCGKSVDLIFLVKNGFKVIGCELSPIACHNFFNENNLSFDIKKTGPFDLYYSEQIQIYCGDFFNLKQADLKDATNLFDRAALIALPKDMRMQYVQHLKKILPSTLKKILLITLKIDNPDHKGPPFSVDFNEVKLLYTDDFSVQILEQSNDIIETAYILSR